MTTQSLRLLACALLTTLAALLAPTTASAASNQLSLFQDDAELLRGEGQPPTEVLNQLDELGVDILRTNVIYNKVYRTSSDRKKPRDFKTEDHTNSHYDWSATDQLVRLAQERGIQMQLTVTGPGPFFSSENPRKCKSGQPCTYKPSVKEFAKFVTAAATRYKGKVAYYSIWNEPNLGKTWLQPRYERRKGLGRIDYAAARYRQLYIAGQKAIAKADPSRRNRVLFGEVPSIADPLPFLRASMCLDSRGRPFRGKRARAQACSGRVSRLVTRGFAIHPYNQGALYGPMQRYRRPTSLTQAHLPRLHRLLDGAVKRKRISRGARDVFITEFGYQSNPPDKNRGAPSLERQARYINESDRLFYGDRRVKWVSQYELTDVRAVDQFNTGLRLFSGKVKPSYAAYRMPIVVTRRSANSVEVYGQSRPGGAATVAIQSQASGGQFSTVRSVRTNRQGMFRVNVSKKNAFRLKWRLSGISNVTSQTITSREATAGKKLRYYKN